MQTIEQKESSGRVISFGNYRDTLPRRINSNDNELSSGERRLLRAMALYRCPIPQVHRIMLERQLLAGGAWAELVNRGYIIAAAKPWHVTLLSSLRNRPLVSIDPSREQQHLREIHNEIASCWLEELGAKEISLTQARIKACEALYHLTESCDDLRLQQIRPEFLSGDLHWARHRLKKLYDTIYQNQAPIHRQRQLLQYRLRLDRDNHAIHRFLGQCWQKEEGKWSRKAIACFETACRLKPDFPPYLVDLGHALLAIGKAGASEFLSRLDTVARDYPEAINDYVNVVRIACIKAIAGVDEANAIRREEIANGSANPAFYADEAKMQLMSGNPAQALEIIASAEERGCANDITTSIKAAVLEKLGRKHESASLRLENIALGSRNPAFYTDEARVRLNGGNPEGALAILDLAVQKNLDNDYIAAIRTTALDRIGKKAEASFIRLKKIMGNSRNCVFYNDEANSRIRKGDLEGAREILELAVRNNCANQITSALWSRIERMTGENGE